MRLIWEVDYSRQTESTLTLHIVIRHPAHISPLIKDDALDGLRELLLMWLRDGCLWKGNLQKRLQR